MQIRHQGRWHPALPSTHQMNLGHTPQAWLAMCVGVGEQAGRNMTRSSNVHSHRPQANISCSYVVGGPE